MIRKQSLIAIAMIASAHAHGQTYDLKGYSLGGNFQEAKSGEWHKCDETYCLAMKLGKPMPLKVSSVAGIDTKYFQVGAKDRANIDSIEARFSSNGYEIVKLALLDKYGKPSSTSESQVQNKMGASFTNEVVKWSAADGAEIRLERYAPDLSVSTITVLSGEAMKRRADSANSAHKAAVKDL